MGLFGNFFKKKANLSKDGSVPTEENLDPPPIPNSVFNSNNNENNIFLTKNRDSEFNPKSPEMSNYASPQSTVKNYGNQDNLQKLEIPEFAPANLQKEEKSLSDMFDKLKSKATQDIPEPSSFLVQKSTGVGIDKELYPLPPVSQNGNPQSESKEVHDEVSGLTLPPLYPNNGNPAEMSGIYSNPNKKELNPMDIESIKPFQDNLSANYSMKQEPISVPNLDNNSENAPVTVNVSNSNNVVPQSDINLPQEKPHPKVIGGKSFLNVVEFTNVINAMNTVITESKIAGEAISRIEGVNHEMELQYTNWQKTIEDFENNIIKLDKIIYKDKEMGD